MSCMDGHDKNWEFFSIEELPLITQNNRLKAAIIGIDQLKALLAKIQKLENELAYYRQKSLEKIDHFKVDKANLGVKKFISWKEEGFNPLDF